MVKLNASQLRAGNSKLKSKISKLKKQEIYIILDNVLDTYNIGSIFRLADAVAAKKIYLCGGTETPPNHRIKKASINTTEVVEWEYAPDAVGVIEDLKIKIAHDSKGGKNLQVVAIEQAPNSVGYTQFDYRLPIALVVGHESDGVSKEVLETCDAIVEIPMFGVNISLNVMVSLGIVMYKALEKTT